MPGSQTEPKTLKDPLVCQLTTNRPNEKRLVKSP
jgi:hypothetical protein